MFLQCLEKQCDIISHAMVEGAELKAQLRCSTSISHVIWSMCLFLYMVNSVGVRGHSAWLGVFNNSLAGRGRQESHINTSAIDFP